MLEHFGVVNRKFVDLTAVVPLDSGDVKWMKQVVEDFNAACESLKIDGRGSFENKVSPDIITEQLKAGAKSCLMRYAQQARYRAATFGASLRDASADSNCFLS